jgi:hypothetical protein
VADPKGFLTTERELPARRPVDIRLQDWREVYQEFGETKVEKQAGRCMDCGIPFCHNGCPLGNLIPEWNDLVFRHDWQAASERLAELVTRQLATRGVDMAPAFDLEGACALFKDRCSTVVELADWVEMFFVPARPAVADLQAHVSESLTPALRALRERLAEVAWDKAAIAQALKDTLAEHRLKMPQLAPAVRVLVCGRAQTPSIDAVLALFERDAVLQRLQHV